ETVHDLRIDWPGGSSETFRSLELNHLHVLTEGTGGRPRMGSEDHAPTWFKQREILKGAVHKETPFDDFDAQPLLPAKHSQLGPGMAWADVDNDGDEDLFTGRSTGKSGRLYVNEGRGSFKMRITRALVEDQATEDMGTVFFDADGDSAPDLYVVSGSVEWSAHHEFYRDRLYLNDGTGTFTKAASDALPDIRTSGSCVVAADFDRDGDLDLFVGSRLVPGAYPTPPVSALLINESIPGNPRFIEATPPDLKGAGMVTGAVWSDFNSDGWIDLALSLEWAPVMVFLNREGKLELKKDAFRNSRPSGWWNSIAAGDLDHDGDIDLVATNQGLNSLYQARPASPRMIFYGDMDNSGKPNIVEASYEGETRYPHRGLSCASLAMPSIGEKLKTFNKYATSTLEEIYTPAKIETALSLEASVLESSVFINDGAGVFTRKALPRAAQTSPGFGLTLADFDADGITDCFIAQNFFSTQPETGRHDGGLGCLLKGKGNGRFEVVEPRLAGIVIPEDAKGTTVTDFNRDGRPDLVVALNNGPLIFLENQAGPPPSGALTIRLKGSKANPTAIGARISVRSESGFLQTAEIQGGSGYLSQSSPGLTFPLETEPQALTIFVQWPNGKRSQHQAKPTTRSLLLEEPAD
ncbi:MAG: CRTAC1 family protein, partial [Verrucomicrobiota bacterium]